MSADDKQPWIDDFVTLHQEIAELRELCEHLQKEKSELHGKLFQIEESLRPKPDKTGFWNDMHESNAALRSAVLELIRTLGMRPIKIGGNRWVPAHEPKEPLLDPTRHDAPVLEALRLTVHSELRDMFEGGMGIEHVRRYLHQTLEAHMNRLVRGVLGIDSYGNPGRDTRLYKQLKDRIEPVIDKLLDEPPDCPVTAVSPDKPRPQRGHR